MQKTGYVWSFLALFWLVPGFALDDPFVGFFSAELDGRRYQLAIDRVSSTTYDGLLQIHAVRLQLDARRFGERVVGILRSHSVELRFGAQLEGSALVLQTEDGRRVVLLRTGRQ